MFVHVDNRFLGFSVVIEHSEASTCWEDVFGGCQRTRALVLTTWGQQVTVIPVIRGYNGFCTGQWWPHWDRNAESQFSSSLICARGYLSKETAFVTVAIESTPIRGFSGSGWE